jgi:hypothetical protein
VITNQTGGKPVAKRIDWDRFKSGGVQFNQVGDRFIGQVIDLDVREGRFGDVPVIVFETVDGARRELWAGAVDLRSKLADVAPEVGDWLDIELIGEQHTGQPSPMKLFRVTKLAGPPGDLGDLGEEPF